MTRQLPLNLKLQDYTRLEDYVGTAASRLIGLQGVVLLSGREGSGKTHLLQGCCHEAVSGGRKAIYLPGLSGLEPAVLEGLEQSALVCLDDIDEVIGNREWEAAIFHLVNAVKDAGGTVMLASGLTVADLDFSLEDLASRVKGAYLVAADELSDDQKLEVIRIKASRRGFDMSEDVCRFILSRSHRDMHHLARLVEQLDEETLRRQKKVTIPFVKAALGL